MVLRCLPLLTAFLLAASPHVVGQEEAAPETQSERLDDAVRFTLMVEHIASLEAAMKEIREVTSADEVNPGVILERLTEKRTNADAFSRLVTDYFLAERIKPPADSDEAANAEYFSQLKLLHAMVSSVAEARRSNAAAHTDKLRKLVSTFRTSLLGEEAAAEEEAVEQQAASPESTAGGGGEQAAALAGLEDMERAIFRSCNTFRRRQGLKELEIDEKLVAAAREHSETMNQRSFFSHRSPLPGKNRFQDRAAAAGTTASAENIARQCTDAQMAMELWLNSGAHRKNIVGSHTRVGVGRSAGYFTLMLGK